MDFIIDLPLVHGYETLLIMVDRFTKIAHIAPCSKTLSAEATTDLFLKNVMQLHGAPNDITSNHRPQLVSRFW